MIRFLFVMVCISFSVFTRQAFAGDLPWQEYYQQEKAKWTESLPEGSRERSDQIFKEFSKTRYGMPYEPFVKAWFGSEGYIHWFASLPESKRKELDAIRSETIKLRILQDPEYVQKRRDQKEAWNEQNPEKMEAMRDRKAARGRIDRILQSKYPEEIERLIDRPTLIKIIEEKAVPLNVLEGAESFLVATTHGVRVLTLEEEIIRGRLRIALPELLLSSAKKEWIKYYWGLDDGIPRTQLATAEKFNTTHKTVSAAQKEILIQLGQYQSGTLPIPVPKISKYEQVQEWMRSNPEKTREFIDRRNAKKKIDLILVRDYPPEVEKMIDRPGIAMAMEERGVKLSDLEKIRSGLSLLTDGVRILTPEEVVFRESLLVELPHLPLSDVEKKTLRYYWGLDDGIPRTQTATNEKFNLNPSVIPRAQKKITPTPKLKLRPFKFR